MVRQNRVVTALIALMCAVQLMAQNDDTRIVVGNDTIRPDVVIVNGTDTLTPSQYIESVEQARKIPLMQGLTLSVDVFGPIVYALSDYGSVEAALRLSLYNQFFPIVEAGYGKCRHTDENTNIYYYAAAPFFRIGCDYNILKNRHQDNRLMVGLRYGVSKFKYDMSGPEISDPVWGGTAPFDYHNASSTCQWAELLAGVQVRVTKYLHMGWSIRYKKEVKVGENDHSRPYYIPGYGTTTNTSCWGGTYNIILDLKL